MTVSREWDVGENKRGSQQINKTGCHVVGKCKPFSCEVQAREERRKRGKMGGKKEDIDGGLET